MPSRPPRRPLFVLIGGATGVGKSTVATALARRLGIVHVVTTDVVREILREALRGARPVALGPSSFEVGARSGAAGRDAVVEGLRAQVAAVAPGLQAVLRRALVEGTDIILEGVHLVPGAIPLPGEDEATVVSLVVVVDDADTHRSYVVARARTSRRPPDRYLARLDDIRRIQRHIVAEAEQHGVPMVHSTTPQATADEALAVVDKALADVG